jgi:hypothetical protein
VKKRNQKLRLFRCQLVPHFLKVTIALALPFIAVSKTMSSSGSDSLGRHRNASRTGLATAAKVMRTRPISAVLNPHAAKILRAGQNRFYSRMSGTERNNSNR